VLTAITEIVHSNPTPINIQFPKHTKADDNRIELAISCVENHEKDFGRN
jgi:hypothetical protein